jgi:transposase
MSKHKPKRSTRRTRKQWQELIDIFNANPIDPQTYCKQIGVTIDRFLIWQRRFEQPVDMRRSFDGLAAIAKNQMQEDPSSGHLFVFINKRRTYLKVLFFDRSGYCIWAKRLEAGQFAHPQSAGEDNKLAMDFHALKLLVEGMEAKDYHQRKRFNLVR